MKKIALLVATTLFFGTAMAGDDTLPLFPQFEIKTSQGSIIVELDGQRSPVSVQNFVKYARDKHYDGTVFHRVIAGFMAQAGGYDKDLKKKPTRAAIPNESGNGLSNARGTLAMARLGDPHSATAQFYINLSDNLNLDPNSRRWGYAVFGHVIGGMDTLDKIAAIPTGPKGSLTRDFPQTVVTIESVRLVVKPPADQ